jgi:hypothetical protein
MRLPVHIWIREENADPQEVAGYFLELARRLDECPRKLRLVIESSVPASLDFDPKDGNPVVSVYGERYRFDIRHRWIPEHPVPLKFDERPLVLFIDPVDGNRFRVRSRRRFSLPGWIYFALAVSATVAVVTFNPVAIAATLIIAVAMIVFYCNDNLGRFCKTRSTR